MNEIIKISKARLEEVKADIMGDIITYLQKCQYEETSKQFQVIDLKNLDDLNNIYSGTGFYIILTNLNFPENDTEFKISDLTAIYRGHSYNVKDRIFSHLFNLKYKEGQKSARYPTNYTVCLKIENGVNGINIDKKPYSEYQWKIVVHKMRGSSELIRQQTELAFDFIYKKPIKSREK